MSNIAKPVTDTAVIKELKDIQRVSDLHDILCLNEAIHALEEKSGIQVKQGETYYLIFDEHIEKRICKKEFADDEPACNVFRTEAGAEHELNRRNIIKQMNSMSPFPNSVCSYELSYDYKRDGIVVSRVKYRMPRRPYFMSKDDAYACLLSIGEDKIRKYYLGIT